jgi:regulator of ribonuclease activity A
LKSVKQGVGERDVVVRFAGVNFVPGGYLYADEDGIVSSATDLLQVP